MNNHEVPWYLHLTIDDVNNKTFNPKATPAGETEY